MFCGKDVLQARTLCRLGRFVEGRFVRNWQFTVKLNLQTIAMEIYLFGQFRKLETYPLVSVNVNIF
jgi:hypothetical protein